MQSRQEKIRFQFPFMLFLSLFTEGEPGGRHSPLCRCARCLTDSLSAGLGLGYALVGARGRDCGCGAGESRHPAPGVPSHGPRSAGRCGRRPWATLGSGALPTRIPRAPRHLLRYLTSPLRFCGLSRATGPLSELTCEAEAEAGCGERGRAGAGFPRAPGRGRVRCVSAC